MMSSVVKPVHLETTTQTTYMELKPLFCSASKNSDAAFDFATYVRQGMRGRAFTPAPSPRSDVTVPGVGEDFALCR